MVQKLAVFFHSFTFNSCALLFTGDSGSIIQIIIDQLTEFNLIEDAIGLYLALSRFSEALKYSRQFGTLVQQREIQSFIRQQEQLNQIGIHPGETDSILHSQLQPAFDLETGKNFMNSDEIQDLVRKNEWKSIYAAAFSRRQKFRYVAS